MSTVRRSESRGTAIVNTTQHWPGNDDEFAALDFGDESGYDSGASGHDSGADLDFGDESGHDGGEQSVVDALHVDEPAEPAETELSAIDALPQDLGDSADTDVAADESSQQMVTVTNPPETVSVTAMMGGSVHSVELSADAGRMTESELAAEILVIADLASQKAASLLHTLLTEEVKPEGVEGRGMLSDLLGPLFMNLPSPKQAAEAQADVFANRYTSDRD
jgi:hypothetical protein